MIRIMIADDHDLYRDVLGDFLSRNGFTVISTFRLDAGLEQTVDLTDLPDIAIIAFKSSRLDSLAGLRWMKEHCPSVKILVTTLFDERVPSDELKQMGIEGVIIKSHADTREIITALHAIRDGKYYY